MLLGDLHSFNLGLSEMDAHLRRAGTAHRPLTCIPLAAAVPLILTHFFLERMLKMFKKDLFAEFSTFLKGKWPVERGPNAHNQQQAVHEWVTGADFRARVRRGAAFQQTSPLCSYTPVYGLVSSFLDEADKQDDRAAAVLRLGAAEEFIRHVNVPRYARRRGRRLDRRSAKLHVCDTDVIFVSPPQWLCLPVSHG